MKTRVARPCCAMETFVNEVEARRRLDRMTQLGVSRVLPMGVRQCARGGWHLDFGKPASSLAAVSKKRQKENAERRDMVKELWPDGAPQCARPRCPCLAEDVHEPLTRARGGSITDPNNAVPLCRGHHDEVGDEAEWAYELALLIHSWEKTPLDVLASVRRQLLAGEVPVEDIAYCHRCRAWLPTDHHCDQPKREHEQEEAA